MNNQEASLLNEILQTLLLEHPDTIMMASMDVLVERVSKLPTPPGTDRHSFVFSIYRIYLDEIEFEESELLAETQRLVALPQMEFDNEARNRAEAKLRSVTGNMTTKEAANFLGRLIRTWLLVAPKDYLLSSEICHSNDDRITAIKKFQQNINGLFELNY